MHHPVRSSNLAILLAAPSKTFVQTLAFVCAGALVWAGAFVGTGEARAQVLRQPVRVAQQPAAGGQSNTTQPGGRAQPNAAQQDSAQPGGGGARPQAAADDPAWHGAPQIVPTRPKQPFVLTAEEEKQLNDVLQKWEEKSDKIKSFKSEFERFNYDTAFGDPKQSKKRTEGKGELRYTAPDRGRFRMFEDKEWAPPISKDQNPQTSDENQPPKPFVATPRPKSELEHWVCDGESIFEVNAKDKKIIQHKLPKEMRGKAISDGPLPFVFGAKAAEIKRRYFIRIVTPQQYKGSQIWLEAWPKFQVDSANFRRVTVILSEPDYVPYALQQFLPGSPLPGELLPNGRRASDIECNSTVYTFHDPKINSLFNWDWLPPITPPGWTKEIEEAPDEQPPAAAAASKPAAGAKGAATPSPQANRSSLLPFKR